MFGKANVKVKRQFSIVWFPHMAGVEIASRYVSSFVILSLSLFPLVSLAALIVIRQKAKIISIQPQSWQKVRNIISSKFHLVFYLSALAFLSGSPTCLRWCFLPFFCCSLPFPPFDRSRDELLPMLTTRLTHDEFIYARIVDDTHASWGNNNITSLILFLILPILKAHGLPTKVARGFRGLLFALLLVIAKIPLYQRWQGTAVELLSEWTWMRIH